MSRVGGVVGVVKVFCQVKEDTRINKDHDNNDINNDNNNNNNSKNCVIQMLVGDVRLIRIIIIIVGISCSFIKIFAYIELFVDSTIDFNASFYWLNKWYQEGFHVPNDIKLKYWFGLVFISQQTKEVKIESIRLVFIILKQNRAL